MESESLLKTSKNINYFPVSKIVYVRQMAKFVLEN